jgi:SAM-dependent methyltransferase
MTPTLAQQQRLARGRKATARPASGTGRARDWAEIQERMLVPLYQAVYERMEVGSTTRLLGLGCGSGLALLLAASRGAAVTGLDADASRLALARERLLPEPSRGSAGTEARLEHRPSGDTTPPDGPPPTLVTAFDTLPDAEGLTRAAARLPQGTPVVLAGWGPPERCSAAGALRVAARLGEPRSVPGCWLPGGRDDLEDLARQADLRLDGSGRVACPFGYADLDSALRGLLSTGLYDAAVQAGDGVQVVKELTETLRPHVREDGTVWMPNLFRYVVARV